MCFPGMPVMLSDVRRPHFRKPQSTEGSAVESPDYKSEKQASGGKQKSSLNMKHSRLCH